VLLRIYFNNLFLILINYLIDFISFDLANLLIVITWITNRLNVFIIFIVLNFLNFSSNLLKLAQRSEIFIH